MTTQGDSVQGELLRGLVEGQSTINAALARAKSANPLVGSLSAVRDLEKLVQGLGKVILEINNIRGM